jgi:hypothetical protein
VNRTPIKLHVEVHCTQDGIDNIEFCVSAGGFSATHQNVGKAFRAAYELYLHDKAADAAEDAE